MLANSLHGALLKILEKAWRNTFVESEGISEEERTIAEDIEGAVTALRSRPECCDCGNDDVME